MPEPLKNLYTKHLIESVARQLSKSCGEFDSAGFLTHVMDDSWQDKELKARMMHIAVSLRVFLPKDYSKAIDILKSAAPEFSGFQYMFFPGFVELHGIDEYKTSISAMEAFTEYSSSEVAVRPFIKKYNKKMMAQMDSWAQSSNHHVRRLASEGCRPRLPWAMALPEFQKDPRPILPILERLKNDDSEYVRRSVANNLNDISKDHPKVVIQLAQNWLGHNPNTDWIVKHACRTLLKQGEPKIMTLFGYAPPEHIELMDFEVQPSVELEEKLPFSLVLKSKQETLGKLRIEYAMYFLKKNGRLSRKLFKISESESKESEKRITKSHSFKSISTRRHYPGTHGIGIVVNGHELAYQEFQLSTKA